MNKNYSLLKKKHSDKKFFWTGCYFKYIYQIFFQYVYILEIILYVSTSKASDTDIKLICEWLNKSYLCSKLTQTVYAV